MKSSIEFFKVNKIFFFVKTIFNTFYLSKEFKHSFLFDLFFYNNETGKMVVFLYTNWKNGCILVYPILKEYIVLELHL